MYIMLVLVMVVLLFYLEIGAGEVFVIEDVELVV